MYNLTDCRIVLGVTGSIAVYKAVDLASKLTQAGVHVDVVMTPEAARFVAPITFQGVTGHHVYSDMWETQPDTPEPHIALARAADLMVVAPATATCIARLALGIPEEMVSLVALATRAPIIVCPAMDSQMYEHETTQSHLETLRGRGVHIIGPEEGRLASGQTGTGRFSEVEKIMGGIRYVRGRANGNLTCKKIVVSAGGTHEPIDPVRFLGNRSSGKMGYAIAEAARDRGAEAVLISGPVALPAPYGVRVVSVERAVEMRDAVTREVADAQALIMAAAVADYQPAEPVGDKIKRQGREGLELSLVHTPDIIAEVDPIPGLIKVAFAAESSDLVANARHKLMAKGVDLVAANDITDPDSGFGTETNRVVLLDRDGNEEHLPLMSKYEVAWRILDRVSALVNSDAS
jgi:phosphopantothenoylcysteine decarboxylase/phosphopantothenate--cysteine ligase